VSAPKNVERSLLLRRRMLLIGLVAGSLLVTGRAFSLQVVHGEEWETQAEKQHARANVLPAPRGTIYDRNGIPLAASHEAFRLSIAPGEVEDADGIAKLLAQHSDLSSREIRRALDRGREWVVLPGRFNAAAREALDAKRGIYFERVLQRFYPRGSIAVELIGTVNSEGTALGGIELEFDSLLNGLEGRTIARRDALGRTLPGVMQEVVTPTPGFDLVLTIDADMQEIAREALADALKGTGATGGELILADPWTGEILAAVSSRSGSRSWRAVTEPYEPGSTLKPFLVASLLAEGKAKLTDSVFAENGQYTHDGRTISDVHGYGMLSIADALKHSSNVVMAKVSTRLDRETQYEYLRGFGFGTPTAVAYPSESGGTLRRPSQWSRYSQASLAIGYEIGVTPLQMVMAYGALANGGVLMEPRLVREVRTRDGGVLRAEPARAVRRVVPERVAAALREVLVEVVEGGSGRSAGLGSFAVAGKTGTARVVQGGAYRSGAYTSSFAGFFPAVDPQLVILVKLDSPRGAYYGGLTAAPVTRATLEAALAALNSPLDRRDLAASAPPPLRTVVEEAPRAPETSTGPFIFALDAGPPRTFATQDSLVEENIVPDVHGLALRDAVRRMHASGYRVKLHGSGTVQQSWPKAGETLTRGSTVRLVAEEVKP